MVLCTSNFSLLGLLCSCPVTALVKIHGRRVSRQGLPLSTELCSILRPASKPVDKIHRRFVGRQGPLPPARVVRHHAGLANKFFLVFLHIF